MYMRGWLVKRSVLVLCVLGFTSLIVGSVLALPSVRSRFFTIIQSRGTVAYPDGSPQQVSNETSLDLSGYAVVLASAGFFAVAFLWNRRSA